MQFARLSIDPDLFLKGVRPWVECESPSWDAAAVSRMMDKAAKHLHRMGAAVRTIPGEKGFGNCVFADFAPQIAAPGILILGHLDTVHPLGTIHGELPWREADGRCYGPGLYDMKGGNYLALEALRMLLANGLTPELPVRVLFTPDEESGSPSARHLIEEAARGAKYVLVPEGAEPNGNLVIGRFPVARFQVITRGKSSHALLQPGEARSALTAMARLVPRIEALASPECSVAVNFLQSGHPIAAVPTEALCGVVSTARSEERIEQLVSELQAVVVAEAAEGGEVRTYTRRLIWHASERDRALWAHAKALADDIGFSFDHHMAFGGSDGNFTGALGIPTLDCLGPVGANAHQLTENIEIASIEPRGRLLAGLLATLR